MTHNFVMRSSIRRLEERNKKLQTRIDYWTFTLAIVSVLFLLVASL